VNLIYDTLGSVLALALLAVAIACTRALRPWLDRSEVKAWVASYWCSALGIGLYLIHARTPDGDLHLTAFRNAILTLGTGLQWVGCIRFSGRQFPIAAALAPVTLYLAVYFALAPELQGRPLAFSLGGIPFFLHGAWVLYREMPPTLARTGYFVSATLALHAGFHIVRAAVLALRWDRADLMIWIALGFLEAFPVLITLSVAQWMLVEHRMEGTDGLSSR